MAHAEDHLSITNESCESDLFSTSRSLNQLCLSLREQQMLGEKVLPVLQGRVLLEGRETGSAIPSASVRNKHCSLLSSLLCCHPTAFSYSLDLGSIKVVLASFFFCSWAATRDTAFWRKRWNKFCFLICLSVISLNKMHQTANCKSVYTQRLKRNFYCKRRFFMHLLPWKSWRAH